MRNKYECLFPFNQIPADSEILIYGAADMGQEYLKQIFLINYCRVVAMIDQQHAAYRFLPVPVYPPSKIRELSFDYVVVALNSKHTAPIAIKTIEEQGVAADKIIYTGIYDNIPPLAARNAERTADMSVTGDKVTICFNLYRAGFGDAIITKKIVVRLIELCPEAVVDIYTAGKTIDYARNLYADYPQVRILSPQNTSRDYEERKSDYMLAVFWDHLLRIDSFRQESIAYINSAFARLLARLHHAIKETKNFTLYELISLNRYMERNIYTSLYYNDILGIADTQVNIPVRNDVSVPTLPRRYITIDLADENVKKKIGKLWSREYAKELVNRIRQNAHDIEIVQVGAADCPPLPGAIPLLGLDFEVVKHILKGAIFHIGIEGGTVHLATQLGTRCIVLFGCSPIWYYGYPQNVNICTGVCPPCMELSDIGFQCVRNMKNPQCMYSITPDMVYVEAAKLLAEYGEV